MRTALSILLIASLSAWLSCSCGAAPHPLPDPEVRLAGLRRAATLDVSCVTTPGGGYGSVVLLDEDTALTAAHVVDPGRCQGPVLYEVVLPSGERHMVVVAKTFPKYDIAVVRSLVPWPDPGPFLAARAPEDGRVCSASGYPYHWWTCGEVQEAEDVPGAELRFSAPVFPGNSGSGLYDAAGRLVGIVTRQVQCASTGQACGGAAARLRKEVFE